MAAGP